MQNAGYGLRRRLLPRTRVNKPWARAQEPVKVLKSIALQGLCTSIAYRELEGFWLAPTAQAVDRFARRPPHQRLQRWSLASRYDRRLVMYASPPSRHGGCCWT